MWFVVAALASIIASLVAGRLLARAAADQTNPLPVRGPSLETGVLANRLRVSASANRLRKPQPAVHLN